MSKRYSWFIGVLVIAVYGLCCGATFTFAQTQLSPGYRFEEASLSTGGSIESNSPNFQSTITVGDPAAGEAESANFQTQAGSETTEDPALTFIVDGSGVDFGSFSASAATVATSTFSVINYTSYGYVVQITGEPPTYNGHVIDAMTTTGPSVAGTEQFGINLVANTSPTSIGANPDMGDFGAGATVAANYGTSNQYRFVNGETIAYANESSGETTYTISYIINVGSLTPGGQYSSNQELICTGTF